ncbi:hypothetical protein Plim_2701 [Planctopirus limnophila DSM 3776]|uniref:Uncharacterized protein n=2 Tax=Planctopirus limnophila TaxID=120 RepID=D5SQR2_PLAL2|nr:hypothetical protein Plim_2701 [Planctopirus limnophila DSM 3776]
MIPPLQTSKVCQLASVLAGLAWFCVYPPVECQSLMNLPSRPSRAIKAAPSVARQKPLVTGSLPHATVLKSLAKALPWKAACGEEISQAVRSSALPAWFEKQRQKMSARPSVSGRPVLNESLTGWTWETLGSSTSDDELSRLMALAPNAKSSARSITRIGKVNQPAALLASIAATRAFTLPELLVALETLFKFSNEIAPDDFSILFARSFESSPPVIDPRPDVVAAQFEAHLLRSLVYAETMKGTADMESAAKDLASDLKSHTDTDGTPHAELLPVLSSWLAVHVRAAAYVNAKASRPGKWSGRVRNLTSGAHLELLAAVLEESARLIRQDGQMAHSIHKFSAIRHVYQAASQFLAFPPKSAAQGLAKQHATASKGRSATETRSSSSEFASSQSDWAHTAVLKAGWEATQAACTIAYHKPWPDVDLSTGNTTLIRGSCGIEASTPAGQLELADGWSCVCWNADEDGDYAELQMIGPERLFLERQNYLSRSQGFALFGEILRGKSAGEYALKTSLPISPELTVESDRLTREWQLKKQGKLVGRVFPLELPQQKIYSTPHTVEPHDGNLVFQYKAQGKAVYAVCVVVWDAKLLKRPAIWRKLTVTEDSRIVRDDEGVGYRLQLGSFQLVVYRSLKPTEYPRAVLGHHTAKETLIGSLDTKTGDVTPLLLVE